MCVLIRRCYPKNHCPYLRQCFHLKLFKALTQLQILRRVKLRSRFSYSQYLNYWKQVVSFLKATHHPPTQKKTRQIATHDSRYFVRDCYIFNFAIRTYKVRVNLLNPTGHVMHQQFNIQQLYVLPTLYLRVLYLSAKKQRLVPLTA